VIRRQADSGPQGAPATEDQKQRGRLTRCLDQAHASGIVLDVGFRQLDLDGTLRSLRPGDGSI
jgi:hypothetical protein